jgi:hypothetical protein
VTGFSAFQFADDKVRALTEAVAQALAESLRPFTGADDRVILPARYRVVLTEV